MTEPQLPELRFSRIARTFDRSGFSCGKEQLDAFVARDAHRQQRQRMSLTWVLHEQDSERILGYYSLCAANIRANDLPFEQAKRLPAYPVPCILLAKLAVDMRWQSKGIGKRLLRDALVRIAAVGNEIGCFAVVVDAIDEEARAFYERYQFCRFPHKPFTLFLPTGLIDSMNSSSDAQ